MNLNLNCWVLVKFSVKSSLAKNRIDHGNNYVERLTKYFGIGIENEPLLLVVRHHTSRAPALRPC